MVINIILKYYNLYFITKYSFVEVYNKLKIVSFHIVPIYTQTRYLLNIIIYA